MHDSEGEGLKKKCRFCGSDYTDEAFWELEGHEKHCLKNPANAGYKTLAQQEEEEEKKKRK